MTLPDEVVMTDSGNDSESGSFQDGNNSSASSASNNTSRRTVLLGNSSLGKNESPDLDDNTASGRLTKLLRRERELIETLEALARDIELLEKKPEDENAGEGGKDEDEEGDDLEEFEAPEWCVPIKANVMTYDWDVSLFFFSLLRLIADACDLFFFNLFPHAQNTYSFSPLICFEPLFSPFNRALQPSVSSTSF